MMYGNMLFRAGPCQEAKIRCFRHGEPLIEQLLGERKDGGVGSDCEGKRDGRDGGEAGAATESPPSIAEVAQKLVPQSQTKRSTHFILMHNRRAERDACAAGGFRLWKSSSNQIRGQILQMIRELRFHFSFQLISLRNGAKPRPRLRQHPRQQSVKYFHTSSPKIDQEPNLNRFLLLNQNSSTHAEAQPSAAPTPLFEPATSSPQGRLRSVIQRRQSG